MAVTAKGGRPLEGARIAMTGKLASLTRPQAAELIRSRGGVVVSDVDHLTTILVVGQDGWPLRKDGRLTSRLQKARRLQEIHPITILSEAELLARLGVEPASSDHKGLSTAELADVLQVSGVCIRTWVRARLLQPHETIDGVHYFDFQQVRWAKSLRAFVKSGVANRRIAQSLNRLHQWLPNLGPGAVPAVLGDDGRMAVRLEDGTLVDPTGQALFDFSERQERAALAYSSKGRDWFQIGRAMEKAGEFEEAARAYREALVERGPDATTCFNLANVLYALGHREQAVERYRQVVELEPNFWEAWNNAGNVLGELGQYEDAVNALVRALEINPGHADAHYNLADILEQIGRRGEALKHWQTYLKHDNASRWADYARTRIKAIS
jgi:tetratricopeptide (TPR) repeat protein